MPKLPVPLAEWRPDLALLDNQFAADVENVFATLNSYTPVPSLKPYRPNMAPIPDPPVVGLYGVRLKTGLWGIFAGTLTKLYKFTPLGWVDVSRTVGGPYHVPTGTVNELWSFASFNDELYAQQIGDTLQVINVDSGTNFADAPGNPPLAHKVSQIGDFLVLSNLAPNGTWPDVNHRMIAWCGINDPTNWVPGIGLSDQQEFPDGGPVQGVAGSETIGYVVQERAVRTMQFLPGDTTFIFSFSRVVQDRGSISEFGFTTVANVLYFLAEEGFYSLAGQQLTPIGAQKVNEWFLQHSDLGRRNIVQCIAANRPWVIWPYHVSTSSPWYDGLMLYNWTLDRWVRITESAYMWATLSSTELDLDTDDPGDPDDVFLDSASPGLDSFAYLGGRPLIVAIDINGHLATLDGPNLQATMETSELHLAPGQRAFVSDVYPLADAPETLVAAGTRERLQDPVTWNPPVGVEITGSAAVYTSSRLHKFRLIIPRGAKWTHAQGALADAKQDGSVA
jgi:hypothetical protein